MAIAITMNQTTSATSHGVKDRANHRLIGDWVIKSSGAVLMCARPLDI